MKTSALMSLIRPDLQDMTPYSSAGMEAGKAEDKIYLNANENPFANPGLDGLNRYPEPQPAALLEAMARTYGVEKDHIVASRGSDECIDLVVRLLCRPGQDSILVCPPTFGMYAVCARLQNAGVIEVPLLETDKGFVLDMGKILSRTDARIIFLCNPNNPTGGSFSLASITDICRAVAGRAAVVVDEAYIEFAAQKSMAPLVPGYPNLIVLRTLSKAYGLAGERIGCAICADMDFIKFMKGAMPPYPVPRSTAAHAVTALAPANAAHIKSTIAALLAERERVAQGFRASPHVLNIFPSDSNFLLVRMRHPRPFIAHCAADNVIIRDRSAVPGIEGCVRVTIGTPEENRRLLKLLQTFSIR